jgi:CRISPR-associated protein Csm3
MGKAFLGKITIAGRLKCLTGLHVGASKENMEIGAIDAPVVRDPVTREPYIPGSSLKGKMRALLEKALPAIMPNREIGRDVKIHVCDDAEQASACLLCRIFGSTGKDGGKNFPARLIVRDLKLDEGSRKKLSEIDTGLQYTEWKFENAIDRITSAANPRQIERVPRGAEFKFELIYNVEDIAQLDEDMTNLRLAIKLVEKDALGGHGSRGYGQVQFTVTEIEGTNIDGFKGKVSGIQKEETLDNILQLKDIFIGIKTKAA